MKHIEIENELTAHIKKRRIIEMILTALFFVILIVFAVLREQSKVIEEIGFGPIKYQSVTYNNAFLSGIMIGALGLAVTLPCLVFDFLCSKFVTFEVGNDFITFYRGNLHVKLYINGELQETLSFGYYMEATLSDGTMVNVALGKWSAHFTFSNGHPPLDV